MAFGVSFGEKVEVRDFNKLGSILIDFYRKMSDALETNNDIHKGIAHLMETNENNVPNPMVEWLKLRLEGLAMESNYGQDSMNVLRTVKMIGEEKNPKNPLYEASYNQISSAGNMDEHHIHYVIDLLSKYKLIEKKLVNDEGKKKDGIKFSRPLEVYPNLIEQVP